MDKKNCTRLERKLRKLKRASALSGDKRVAPENIERLLSALIEPEDTVLIEGDNQKQATFLAKALSGLDPEQVHDLHMVIPSVQLAEHLELFRRKIASTLDFSFAGSQSREIVPLIRCGRLQVRSLQTYLELYARLFTDLIPDVCLIAAEQADESGNLYTGSNTEDTPVLAEATAFKSGIVIAQVNELVTTVKRVDIPGDRVDYIVRAETPCLIDPIFTRDPALIKDEHILMAMMTIKGIYARHGIKRLNHGIGFNTAAIELLLPTYGEQLGLKGKICTNWVLNPHPTLIPAIERGWVESVMAFGGELGMERYVAEHPDIFTVGKDGTLRSNRALAQVAGLYGIDSFTGSTLQIDAFGNASTVTSARLSGFGGAPNMGSNPNGRRFANAPWISLQTPQSPLRGRKCVVLMLKTVSSRGSNFVNELDAIQMGEDARMAEPPIMIYGDDVSHIVTERGIACVYQASDIEERQRMIASVAGDTPLGQTVSKAQTDSLRTAGKVFFPEDLGIDEGKADRSLLAAKDLHDLVDWSGGLYCIPRKLVG